MTGESFISRWSRRKLASEAGAAGPTADAIPVQTGIQSAGAAGPTADAISAQAGTPSEASTLPGVLSASPQSVEPTSFEPLPPVESLTPESDFTPFMKPEVDPALRRQAFKKLMEDPRYNVMDGLDVYIDDYSKADPLPEGWLEKMSQVRYLGIFKEPGVEEEGAGRGLEPAVGEKPASAAPELPPGTIGDVPGAALAPSVPADTSNEESQPAQVRKREV
jgi:hypothetical protein